MSTENTRAAFEAWMARPEFNTRSDTGKYESAHVDAMWSAWQAARALYAAAPMVCVKPCTSEHCEQGCANPGPGDCLAEFAPAPPATAQAGPSWCTHCGGIGHAISPEVDEQCDHCDGTGRAAPPAAKRLTTCNCRWDGDTQVQQCTLHAAHVDAIHEWAERAKTAEAINAAPPAAVQDAEPVAWQVRETTIHGWSSWGQSPWIHTGMTQAYESAWEGGKRQFRPVFPRPAAPLSEAKEPHIPIRDLLRIYDEHKGDWCDIAREVERRTIAAMKAGKA